MIQQPLLVVGGGAMGEAILAGALSGGVLRRELVGVTDVNAARREHVARAYGVAAFDRPRAGLSWLRSKECLAGGGCVLLAVKPQTLPEVAGELADSGPRPLVSILAGVTLAALRAAMPWARAQRVMPNLALRVGQGISAWAEAPESPSDGERWVERLFGVQEQAIVRLPEVLMDAFTAIAGSGPAYVFYLAEAMIRAGVELGLDPEACREIVAATIRGAGAMLGDREPGELRASVTSKGGTTAAAVAVLDAGDVTGSIVGAVRAARDRGRSLAQG